MNEYVFMTLLYVASKFEICKELNQKVSRKLFLKFYSIKKLKHVKISWPLFEIRLFMNDRLSTPIWRTFKYTNKVTTEREWS